MMIDTDALVLMMAKAGPIGAGTLAIAEKMFPFIPSYVVFVLLGMTVASSQGDLATTAIAAAVGSTIGTLWWYGIGFALGSQRSAAFIERCGRFFFLNPALYQRMAGAYCRNHFWVTVLGQTIPAVRVYLAIPAGVLNLALATFLAATLIGSFVWSTPLLILGYLLGNRADVASAALLVIAALIALELMAIAAWRVASRHRRRYSEGMK
jgi:membrane protein DedA with SNARE-associated domain